MRPGLTALLCACLAGCSWANAPDRNLLPPDGGTSKGIELFCDDGLDDDEDSAIDCGDPDCAEEPACCERRSTTLDEDWSEPDLSSRWTLAPSGGEAWTPLRPSLDGTTFVGGFLPADSPRALVSHDCVSLALGGWLSTVLHSSESGGCAANEACEDYAGVLLTVSTDSVLGSKLQDEIAVTLHAGGLVRVTQADVEIARASVAVGEDVDVEVELRPTLDTGNQPVLTATVRVDGMKLLDGLELIPISNLLSTGDCAEIPGLHLAAQGRGERVYVGPLETAKQDCANPSQFDEQSATLRSENLEFTPAWVEGYVGSPGLASSRNSVSDVQWDLMLEASNWGPEAEAAGHVGYALGHARATTDEGSNWRLTDWESSVSPKVGDEPPACTEPACADNRSIREPHLFAELNESQELRDLSLSFARELVTNPTERDLFGIQIVRPVGSPATSIALPSAPTLSPDALSECISLRDPALIPVDPEALNGYWLLFTCVEGPSPPRRILAVRISRALEVVQEGGEPMWRTALDADELGPFAAAGIRSPEPVISFEEDGLRLRLWFLAQATPGDWALALAEARTHDTELLALDIPELIPFPVNPILSNRSTLVQSGCLSFECSITGIAVAPRADDPSRLRFLLARRLKVSPTSYDDQLIPLEQTWRTP